jgi:hypothetical protein
MRILRTAAAMAALTLVATACDNSPTEPEFVSADAAVESALMGAGSPVDDGAPMPAILARLTNAALLKIGHDDGRDAARAALDELRPYFQDVRTARQAHDSAAIREAFQALRQAEAEFIVATLGTGVVDRALEFAEERVTRLEEMIQHATAGGHDPGRLQELATRLRGILDHADAAIADGDYPAALIDAADVIGAVHFLRFHFPDRR